MAILLLGAYRILPGMVRYFPCVLLCLQVIHIMSSFMGCLQDSKSDNSFTTSIILFALLAPTIANILWSKYLGFLAADFDVKTWKNPLVSFCRLFWWWATDPDILDRGTKDLSPLKCLNNIFGFQFIFFTVMGFVYGWSKDLFLIGPMLYFSLLVLAHLISGQIYWAINNRVLICCMLGHYVGTVMIYICYCWYSSRGPYMIDTTKAVCVSYFMVFYMWNMLLFCYGEKLLDFKRAICIKIMKEKGILPEGVLDNLSPEELENSLRFRL